MYFIIILYYDIMILVEYKKYLGNTLYALYTILLYLYTTTIKILLAASNMYGHREMS